MKRIICLSTLLIFLASFAIADERTSSGSSLFSSLMRLFFPCSQAGETIHPPAGGDEDMTLQKDKGEDKGGCADISIFRRGHRIKPDITPVKGELTAR